MNIDIYEYFYYNYKAFQLFTMKKIIFFLFILHSIFIFKLAAQEKNKISLKGAIHKLKNESNRKFFYLEEWIPDIEIEFPRKGLKESLSHILRETQLSFALYRDYAVIIADKNKFKKDISDHEYERFLKMISLKEKNQILSTLNQNSKPKSKKNPKKKSYFTVGKAGSKTWKATINGKIVDESTKEPAIGATIYIPELGEGKMTDSEGNFEFTLPKGLYSFDIKMIGYDPRKIKVNLVSSGALKVDLYKETVILEELVVSANKIEDNISKVQMGVEKISPIGLRELPGLMGEADAIKGIKTLSGVSSVGEGAMGINVRGGNVDNNLLLLDEISLFNASHIFGFYSLFNSDLLSSMTLYKGSMPSEYGGRLSSVLKVNTSNTFVSKTKAKLQISPVSANSAIEIPIWKEKTNLFVGARFANPTWVMKSFKNENLKQSTALYYDLNIKLLQKLHKNTELSVLTLLSHDEFNFHKVANFKWGTKATELTVNQKISKNIAGKFTYVYSNYASALTDPLTETTLKSGVEYNKAKALIKLDAFKNQDIDIGTEYYNYNINPGEREKEGLIDNLEAERATEYSVFVNDVIKFSNLYSLQLGIRYTDFNSSTTDSEESSSVNIGSNYTALEPRVGLKLGLNKHTSIKLSYNRTQQFLHLLSNTTSATPYDVWKASNKFIKPQKSHSFSIGYFQNYQENLYQLRLETYYKDIDGLIEYKDFADVVMNPEVESELIQGKGRAYGIETTLEKTQGKISGTISYAFAKTERRMISSTNINNGNWYPSNFDKPHEIKIDFRYKPSPAITFAANFIYASGRPITIPDTRISVGRVVGIPIFSGRNNYRTPAYHRLDLSVTIKNANKRKKVKSKWILGIYNVYARKNPYSVYYKHITGNKPGVYKLSVLGSLFPSITYSIELN